MSVFLFAVSKGYLSDIKGIRYWATALLLQGLGWILLAVVKINPILLSIGAGSTLVLLSLAYYFQALVVFKETNTPVKWAYWLVVVTSITQACVYQINHSIATKNIIVGTSSVILLFASSYFLLIKRTNKSLPIPVIHKLTGYMFVASAWIMIARVIYYSFWGSQQTLTIFEPNIIQDISYFCFFIMIVMTSFGFVLMCIDKYIAEKNHAQLAQQETLDRFQILFDRASEGIVIVKPNGQLLKVNESFARMHGYTPQEMQTMELSNLDAPETLQLLPERIQQILSGEPLIFEVEHYHKEGHIFPMEVSASLIFF
jgi:PAS domain S-box-containing protein